MAAEGAHILAADGERLLTVAEVAAAFRVEKPTVIRWLQEGRIEGTRTPGGQWRIFAWSVHAYLTPANPARQRSHGGLR